MKRKPSPAHRARHGAAVAESLRQRRGELLGEIERLEEELRQSSEQRDSEDDAAEQACLVAVEFLVHLRRELREVTDALARAQRGELGICDVCGEQIPIARMRAVPTARRCLNCQLGAEKRAS